MVLNLILNTRVLKQFLLSIGFYFFPDFNENVMPLLIFFVSIISFSVITSGNKVKSTSNRIKHYINSDHCDTLDVFKAAIY